MTDKRRDSFAAKPWQAKISRRRFLGGGAALAGAAALAGYLPESVARAAAAPAATRSGGFDLSQIKHLVFLQQENRSFDHYFGTYPGAAGFSDPNAIRLPDGNSVFQQPDPDNPDGYLEPWHLDTINTGAAAVPDLSHAWQPQHASWNGGKMDGWLRAHIAVDSPARGPFTMGYYTREDIPFHWALADEFTLCDQYHCGAMATSTPNHLIWGNGTNDPQGLGGGPLLDETIRPFTFESGAETMYKAGISFKFYQPVTTPPREPLTGPIAGGSPLWEEFANFESPGILPPALYNSVMAGGTLWGNGTPGGVGDPANPTMATTATMAFAEDCANGVLPDVSFVYSAATEHPSGLPAAGAQYLAMLLDALTANEDLWSTTAFLINYDENDGFFDHVPPPTPDRDEFPEEFVTKVSPGGTPGGDLPVGAGFRVPNFIISPWSTGGRIFSGVSDHSSNLRLIESVAAAGGFSGRGPVTFPLISRWRRQTFSDLTGAFSGAPQPAPSNGEFTPATRAANLPAQTASSKLPLPPFPGTDQTMPVQLKK